MNRTTRGALQAAAAGLLLAALAFLFVKTAGVEVKNETQSLSLLRELKELDNHWDDDMRRQADDFGPVVPQSDFAAMMARLLGELDRMQADPAFRNELGKLRAGLEQKAMAASSLRTSHAASRQANEALHAVLGEIEQAATSHAGGKAPSAQLAVVQAKHVGQSSTRRIENYASRRAGMQDRIQALASQAQASGLIPAATAGRLRAAGDAFFAARTGELAAFRKFTFLTLGGRIDLTMRTLSASIEHSLDEKDRWRAYLFAYALALLIATGYLGARFFAAQAELRRSNEELERRVSERTRDLSATLKRLQESEAQLVQSEKMSSLGQMVAGVAHEINSPLAYVKSGVSTARARLPELRELVAEAVTLLAILRSESPNEAELQSAFETLEHRLQRIASARVLEELDSITNDGLHGIEQIAELVGNLRNFSRLDRSKVASFNVNEGVHATLLIAKSALRKVDVERRLGDVPSITCSPSQVNQVLLNLVTNSAQAMDKPRGRIVITTRAAGADAVAIDVEDNGRGIAADALPRIFDPFYTTKEVGKGTGLGLSIAYKIVSQHGGRIDVRSAVGEGTTVTVVLPVSPPPELADLAEEGNRVAA